MKIAIDIDNTLLTCRSLIYKIMSVVEKNFSLKITKNPVVYKKGEARIFANKHRNILFGNMGNIKMYKEIDGAIDVINKLAENGHSIMFLSNRPNIRFLNNVVMNWLEENKVKYDFVVINCGDKIKFCKEHGVDLLIDDSLRNCKDASKAGINSILFGAKTVKHDYYVDNRNQKLNYDVSNYNSLSEFISDAVTDRVTYNQPVEDLDESITPIKTWEDVGEYLNKMSYTLEDAGREK